MLETKICRVWEAGMWEKRTWKLSTGVLTKMQERQRESVPCCQWRDDEKTTFSQISQDELRST